MINPDIINQALKEFEQAKTLLELNQLRIKFLGKQSEIAENLASIGKLPPTERSAQGKLVHEAQARVFRAWEKASTRLNEQEIAQKATTPIDMSIPVQQAFGHDHPVSQLLDETIRLCWQMGFSVTSGPEVETEWYNFEALSIGKDHPARDMQDTFYLEGGNLPRTHTSSMQIRYMEKNQPPIRIISPGRVYRNEDEGPKSTWMFTQVEGLVVAEGISVAHLKGTLLALMEGLLGKDTKIRLRPSYFPYTEPSLEVDATCPICRGRGCNTCQQTGWVEVLGSGMVHERVLTNVGIDPSRYSGFAFGMGLERLAIIKYGISDIRHLWRPNIKLLEQF